MALCNEISEVINPLAVPSGIFQNLSFPVLSFRCIWIFLAEIFELKKNIFHVGVADVADFKNKYIYV